MRLKNLKRYLSLIIILLLLFGITTYTAAEESTTKSPWSISQYLEIWGTGVMAGYYGFPLIKGLDTSLWGSFCGYYKDDGFYRNPDGTPYTPTETENLGPYKIGSLFWSAGVKQGIVYDKERNRNLVEAFLFYKGRFDANLPDSSPTGSLIFNSGLPDKDNLIQNSFLTGVVYNGVDAYPKYQVQKGTLAELSYEYAPQFINDISDFSRVNFKFMEFVPFLQNDKACIFLGERFIFDQLQGGYIPVNARTTFGGLMPFPGAQTPGLGGALRGINSYATDAYGKVVNNLEIRVGFPSIIGHGWVPGLIGYYDAGVTDNLTGTIDFDKVYKAAGLGIYSHVNLVIMEADLALYEAYYFNEQKTSTVIELGMHF